MRERRAEGRWWRKDGVRECRMVRSAFVQAMMIVANRSERRQRSRSACRPSKGRVPGSRFYARTAGVCQNANAKRRPVVCGAKATVQAKRASTPTCLAAALTLRWGNTVKAPREGG